MEIERSRQTLQTLARDLSLAGDRDALASFYKGEISRTSFRDLGTEVERQARMLTSKGIGASDPVVLCGPGGADWIIACLAILRCGGCVVPVDNQFTAQTFEYVVKDCGARCALVASSARKRFRASLEKAGIEVLPLTVEFAQSVCQDFPRVNPGDRAILCYTSGTTGPPKGVPLSHQNIAFQIDALAKARLVTVGDRVLLPLPLHHVYPLVIGMLTALALGLTLILPDGFTGPRILAALREGEATLIIGVPRLYQALVEGITNQIRRHGSIASLGFRILLGFSRLVRHLFGWQIGKALFAPMHRRFAPSLETIVSGGAALKPEIARTLESLGWQVTTGYGLTETSPMLTINPPGKARLDTAGQPVPGVELRVEHGAGKEGALGEVLARGPGVFAGYHGLPDKTKAAFTADGWFRTGDLGRIDDDGWLHLVGRGSTLIVTQGGENVQPEQIEDAYQAHPAVAELAVFEKDGRIAALIVPNPALLRDGNPEEAVHAAVQEVSQRLPSYQRISEYRLTREAIPRTRLGKPQVHLISDRYRRAATESLFTEVRQAEPVGIEDLSADDQALLGWASRRCALDRAARDCADRLRPSATIFLMRQQRRTKQMTKRYEDFREDDAFDENGLLGDGHKTRVPLTMRDEMTHLQREIATKRARITDGSGKCDEFAFSRPGFRILHDAAVDEARAAARQEYLDYITNAWRTEPPRV